MRKVMSFIIVAAGIAAVSLLVVQAKDAEIGNPAPEFTLSDLSGKARALSEFKGKFVVLEWTNPECPFVKKHYGSGNMQGLQKAWTGKDVVWLTLCSSAEGKQGFYGAEEWKKLQKDRGAAPTATLLDPDGKAGKAYGAKTTPHMFVVNPMGMLIYKGAIDDKRSADPGDVKDAKNFVDMALTQSMAGEPVRFSSTQSYGCSVKYK
ncbi:MAG: alkyl hydroperoxide reductase [Elusimicrobia bacterium RIFCSPLOWO2_01_FULL_60_11]|nr:MAG: alkyl hydroperoxide reductase [Elusimicrobia bacterium RIFCSPLOWO2_01_FULL_60_11]